jgi:amino acid transporter
MILTILQKGFQYGYLGRDTLMARKNWIPHIILAFFNILLLLSVWFSYADSHGMLRAAAVTEGTVYYTLIAAVFIVSFCLALVPYGCGVLVISVVSYLNARKKDRGEPRPKLRFVIVAIIGFIVTLAVKYIFLISAAAEILFPENFHI